MTWLDYVSIVQSESTVDQSTFLSFVNCYATYLAYVPAVVLLDSMEGRPEPIPTPAKREAPLETAKPSSSKRIKVDEVEIIPDTALLYHFAYTTWQSSNRHLSYVFIPSTVEAGGPDSSFIHLPDPFHPKKYEPYKPDPRAVDKAISLQVLAIDTLKVGLKLSSLSDTERVTFGLLFGKIGIQLVQGLRARGKGKEKVVDDQVLLRDVEEQINVSVSRPSVVVAYTADGSRSKECIPALVMPAARATQR